MRLIWRSVALPLMAVLGMAAASAAPADDGAAGQAKPRVTLAMVLNHAPDTPDGKPYLGLAADNVEQARRLLRDVLRPGADAGAVSEAVRGGLHLLDPQYGGSAGSRAGDTLSFGARQALARAVEGLQAASREAADDQRLAAALACAQAAQSSLDEGIDLGRASLVGASPRVGWQGARAMALALDHVIDGWDRDGDGVIKWQRAEGGLAGALDATRGLAAQQ